MTKKELGMNLFKQGYNCAQSVAGAFSDEMNMSVEEAVKIASPFGGGMGRMREVCGAVSGMFLVLWRIEGNDAVDPTKQKALYEKVQMLAEKFKSETGSIVCKELLGLTKKENDPTPEKRDEKYYKKRPCAELVGLACEIMEEYLGSK